MKKFQELLDPRDHQEATANPEAPETLDAQETEEIQLDLEIAESALNTAPSTVASSTQTELAVNLCFSSGNKDCSTSFLLRFWFKKHIDIGLQY